jgi:hypothetical protein
LTSIDLRTLGNAPVRFELHRYQRHLLASQKQTDVAAEAVINKESFVFGQQNSEVIIE